jgi:Ca-activated chloride channel family protein
VKWQPFVAWPWVLVAAVVGLAIVGLAARLGSGRRRVRLAHALRQGAIVAVAALIVLQPVVPGGAAERQEATADIFILVDISPSMVAEDWGEGQPRLDGVKADLEALATTYAGSRFCLITFEATGRLAMPLTADAGALLAAADTLVPVVTDYASGSSIDSGLTVLKEALQRASKAQPDRTRLVYYLGDGEQTRNTEPKSFGQVADLVNGGAVWGYGTQAGGPMLERTLSNREDGYIADPANPEAKALSHIDEDNLRAIAEDLGVEYHLRQAGSGIGDAVWQGEIQWQDSDQAEEGTGRSLAWILAWLLLVLTAWEVAVHLGALESLRAAFSASRTAKKATGGAS